jgi:hypothetical protein
MSLLQSAKLNKREPWAYLKDMLTRCPTVAACLPMRRPGRHQVPRRGGCRSIENECGQHDDAETARGRPDSFRPNRIHHVRHECDAQAPARSPQDATARCIRGSDTHATSLGLNRTGIDANGGRSADVA